MGTRIWSIYNRRLEVPIFIAKTLQTIWKQWLSRHRYQRLFILVDQNVLDRYRQRIQRLQELSSEIITIPAGEQSKSRVVRDWLEDQLLQRKVNRRSLIVVVGGGMVGDVGGFVAATLHRGIPYVFFPTTLLAQVDSCLGGKVGINHPLGKNLLGTFYHPQAVFVELDFIRHLPQEQFLNGLAEVFKYAILFEEPVLMTLLRQSEKVLTRTLSILRQLVEHSLRCKQSVVEADEQDRSLRAVLNFGHTVAHALEQYFNYRIPHGFAMIVGLIVELELSVRLVDYPLERKQMFLELIARYPYTSYLPSLHDLDSEALWLRMRYDKKSDQQVRCVLLDSHCRPVLFYPLEKQQFCDAWKYCQTLPFLLGAGQ